MEEPSDWGGPVLPAWGLPTGAERPVVPEALPGDVTREWALGGATGAGVRVCILDSGIEAGHQLVGEVERSVTIAEDGDEPVVVEDDAVDVSGHGTACGGIVRALAPEVTLASVRVLGADVNGSFTTLEAGLAWAIDEGYDILNLSLAVRSRKFALDLCELADRGAFGGSMLVSSAHNQPVESWPWRFASVVSVGSHEEDDPWRLYYNPEPPVEFYARGVDVPIAWPGGGTLRATGNSFAAPHVSGFLALIRSKHPHLTPFELKTVLYRIADNVGDSSGT